VVRFNYRITLFYRKDTKDWHARPPYHLKPGVNTLVPSGISPAKILKAYGFPANLQGLGQIIAIVDAMDDPNIEADLNIFSSTYNLPACTTANGCFKKIYVNGRQPTGDPSWGVEISLDVEWVHAIAPLAKIILVESGDSGSGLYDAVNLAVENNATVISCSWGAAEYNGEQSLDYVFQNSPVPVVVASGDSGYGVNYPAASPYVLSVGGTSLTLNMDGSIASEIAWSGSGGGVSAYEIESAYQKNYPIPQDPNMKRGVPDVSYHASPSNGYSIYDSYGQGGWLVVGGTSAAAPQWAALIAIANSAAGKNLATANTSFYNAALSSYSSLYNDITSGQNGSCGFYCRAAIGYDYVTGLGSPQALHLISYLSAATQIIQIANSLDNSEASSPGVTKSDAVFKFYTGSSVLCDSRIVTYGGFLTVQPGVSGSATGHTSCTSTQAITSITATPIIANVTIGPVFGTSPVSYTVMHATGVIQALLKLKAPTTVNNVTTDYAPIFDSTNGKIVTPGTPDLV
jgi:subtilase family serine protease